MFLFSLLWAQGYLEPLPNRIIPEWSPALGTVITWPLDIPCELVQELAKDDHVWLYVANPQDEAIARAAMNAWSIPPERITYVLTSTETSWTRDYGPHQVFDAANRWLFLDAIYIDTPPFFQNNPPVARGQKITYFGTFPGDDRTNEDFAALLGTDVIPVEAYLTGGNYLVDGLGTAFVTRAMVDENNVLFSDEEFHALVDAFTATQRLIVVENNEPWGIQHIDCFFKILDPETLLVKRAPQNHPEYAPIERIMTQLQKLTSPYGRPYTIHRIDCPPFGKRMNTGTKKEEEQLPAYTNSLILNKKVLVPLFGNQSDLAALETYRKAMPGYRIVGIPYRGWRGFDALHCRTRAVFDRHMLELFHAPAKHHQPSQPTELKLTLIDHAAQPGPLQARAFWRVQGQTAWQQTALQIDGTHAKGALPAQAAGVVLEYYLEAERQSGSERLPRTAPEGCYTVEAKHGAR